MKDEILKNQERLLRKVIAVLDEHITLMTKYATPTTFGNPPTLSKADAEKYELTGEYRVPGKGERWFGQNGKRVVSFETAYADTRLDFGNRWIVREKPKPPVPAPPQLRPEDAKWFEYTGEYRYPKHNELYLFGTVVDVAEFDFKNVTHHIVRFRYAKETK